MKSQWMSYVMLFFSLFSLALLVYRRRSRKTRG
jgi:LPXTG-motif cell wall-anchored protein